MGFPLPFGALALASWVVLFPAGLGPPSRASYPRRPGRRPRRRWTCTGLPRSACARCDRSGCPLCPEATVLPRPTRWHRSPSAASQRPALHPGLALRHRGSLWRGLIKDSLTFTAPAFPGQW